MKLQIENFKLEREAPKEARNAVFSECERYRYTLEIVWEEALPRVQFIGLNPSTADQHKDDPTLRRVKQFAKDWGYGGVVMTNLFAFRATDPKVMLRERQPIGDDNDRHLIEAHRQCSLTVAAWGAKGNYFTRDYWVLKRIPGMMCLRKTSGGFPEHPLYVPAITKPIPFN